MAQINPLAYTFCQHSVVGENQIYYTSVCNVIHARRYGSHFANDYSSQFNVMAKSYCCHSFIGHDVAQNICTCLDCTAVCHVQNVVMSILFRLRVRAKTKLPSNLNNKSFADGSVKSNAHAELADWLDVPEFSSSGLFVRHYKIYISLVRA